MKETTSALPNNSATHNLSPPSTLPPPPQTSNGPQNPPRPLRQMQRSLLQHRRGASPVRLSSLPLFPPFPSLPSSLSIPPFPPKKPPTLTNPLPTEPPATQNPSKSSAPTIRFPNHRPWAKATASRSRTSSWIYRGRSTGWVSGRSRASRRGGC